METKFDWITALSVVGLLATILAFFTGAVPYPYGWMVFSVLLVYRLSTGLRQEQ